MWSGASDEVSPQVRLDKEPRQLLEGVGGS